MTDLTVRAVVTAVDQGLVATATRGAAAFDDLKNKQSGAAASAKDLAQATSEAQSRLNEEAKSANTATDAIARKMKAEADAWQAAKNRQGSTPQPVPPTPAPAPKPGQPPTDPGALPAYLRQNLSFQINDVVSGLAQGQDPFRILTQQAGQFVQIMQQGGVGPVGLLKAVGEQLGKLVTPATLLGGTMLILGGAIAYAANRAVDTEITIEKALFGIGRAAGLTVSQVQDVAVASARASGISVSSARDIELAFVSTGMTGGKSLQGLVDLTTRFARTSGEDMDTARDAMTKAFADPAGAGEKLLQSLGALDDGTRRYINSMVAQGNVGAAQEAVMRRINSAIDDETNKTTALGRAWQGLGNTIDNVLEGISDAVTGGAISNQIAVLKTALAQAQTGVSISGEFMPDSSARRQLEDSLRSQIAKLEAQQRQQQQKADNEKREQNRNRLSLEQGQIEDRLDPYSARVRQLQDDMTHTIAAYNAGAITEKQRDTDLAAAKTQLALATKQHRDQLLSLNEAERDRLQREKSLIEQGSRAVDQEELEASALAKQSALANGTALARQKLADSYAIEKATLPYVVALQTAHGAAAEKLRDIIDALTESMGRQQAARHNMEAVGDITSQMGSLSDNAPAQAIAAQYAIAIRAADQWREKALANLDQTAQGYDEFAAEVEFVHNDLLAKAMDDDLARRKDWAAGVERANLQIVRSSQDMATLSQNAITGFSETAEGDFVNMVKNVKADVSDLADFVIEQLARMAYQQSLAGPVNMIGNAIFKGIGSLFGASVGASSFMDAGTATAAVAHSGGTFGTDMFASRTVDASLIGRAPRYHKGGDIGPDEHLVVTQTGEKIFTPRQLDNANSILMAAMQRPIIVGDSGAAPKLTVNIQNNAPDTKVTANEPKRNQDGSMSLDVIVDRVDASLASRQKRGQSQFGTQLKQDFGLERNPP